MNTSNNIIVSKSMEGLLKITFNRPERLNALDENMFASIKSILQESSEDPTVKVIAFTGIGSYFSSGYDMKNFFKAPESSSEVSPEDDMATLMQRGKNSIKEFVAAFIDCPKILVAIVNGPAIGIGVTILAHFDLVFASKSATFSCPFTQLGLTMEGCSSLLFPLLMGFSKAAQMLIFGKKIDAIEAYSSNLVTKVVDEDALESCWEEIDEICKPNHYLKTEMRNALHEANDEECEVLFNQWTSEEFIERQMKFLLGKKSKL
ncbi:Enoyl-CoA delta isomerase 2, mitochondrial [Armadillidium nasatum]|uniref:Enoyl-CoA delta isomerase 2, mitochondrial n=1 Tax=Armadillidium nasatum TaxID=96803 RepID=A0A5N5TNS8_9CRUS|nr:Enoyl-CoA delta isomerase 2, mitochondrial [Armadillidium nasatum]